MASFDEAYEHLFPMEIGYSDHPSDRGGRTLHGLSERWYPQLWKDGPPTLCEIRAVYVSDFWNVVQGDKLESQLAANEAFEQAVNSGPRFACKNMQLTFNYMRREGQHPGPLVVDGVVGPKTLAAVNAFTADYEHAFYARMNVLQALHFDNLVARDESQRDFLRGWYGKRVL